MKPNRILSENRVEPKYLVFLFFVAIFLLSTPLFGQLNLKEKIKNATGNRASNKTEQGIEKSLDAAENGVKNLFRKKEKTGDKEGQQAVKDSVSNNGAGASSTGKQSLQSFSKYDFVPGDKILFFEDFSQDAVGDFPADWTSNGSGEVKTINIAPGNWLHMNTKNSVYCYLKDINFPANYIVEFDIVPDDNFTWDPFDLNIYGEDKRKELNDDLLPGNKGFKVELGSDRWGANGYVESESVDNGSHGDKAFIEKGKVNHVVIWVQNRRIRIYHQGMKVIDGITTLPEKPKYTRLRLATIHSAEATFFVSNLKVTTAAPDTRSKLLTEGKLISYGIYFDVNKDVVKPESYGTLNDIAKVLKDNPSVRVKIVGHTDSDGADAANLDLSKRRGASVKNELVKTFGIDASRIESDGLGETQPIAPNDTPANKALNRRVEFIKL